MPFTVKASEHQEWEENRLADYSEFSDMVEYVNQRPDYCDSYRGDWYYIPDGVLPPMEGVDYGDQKPNERVIYFGSFGNDNSPGADSYTNAEIFDMDDPEDAAEFEERKAEWEAAPEYLDDGEDDGQPDELTENEEFERADEFYGDCPE